MLSNGNRSRWKSFLKIGFVLLLAYVPYASAQKITGRFYPERHQYLVGEPIFVVFEIVNRSPTAVEISESGCPWAYLDQFKVDGASPTPTIGHGYGCGGLVEEGSCAESFPEIPTGGIYRKRFLLDGHFELHSPGTYHVRAERQETILNTERKPTGANLTVDSEFDVDLRVPKPGELETAYQPYLGGLDSSDTALRSFAIAAVTQNPPIFAEAAILNLSHGPMSTVNIPGLKRLATPAARARLLEMASPPSPEYVRLTVVDALGEIENPDDCQAILNIAGGNKDPMQGGIYTVAGRICKEQALPILFGLVSTGDSQLLMGAAGGLGNTSSRSAVPPLISLLQNADQDVRRAAASALATLTHRRSKYGIEDKDPGKLSFAYGEWTAWWSTNDDTAPIYSSDQCVAAQPLL